MWYTPSSLSLWLRVVNVSIYCTSWVLNGPSIVGLLFRIFSRTQLSTRSFGTWIFPKWAILSLRTERRAHSRKLKLKTSRMSSWRGRSSKQMKNRMASKLLGTNEMRTTWKILKRMKLEWREWTRTKQEMKHDEDIKGDFADKSTHCSVLADGEPTGRWKTQLHQRNEEC